MKDYERNEDTESVEESNIMEEPGSKGSGFFWKLMLAMALLVFAFSAYQLYAIFTEYKDGVDQYGEISDMVVQRPEKPPVAVEENEIKPEDNVGTNGDDTSDSEAGNDENSETNVGDDTDGDSENSSGDNEDTTPETKEYIPPEINFNELKKINKDVVGWIEIEAIPSISYPIVRANNNDKYLHKTIYGKSNSAGSIFMDYRNNGNFMDCNTIIYGHNMKNGSMFGLLKMLYEQSKYKNSQYIWICTPEAKYRYEIFSMQYANVSSSTYAFYQKPGKEFQQYLIEMAMKSKVDMQAHYLSEQDRVITLSTCTSNDNTRFVVQARWIATY